jgi:hypothetical protein
VIAVLSKVDFYWPDYFNGLLFGTVAVTAASGVHYMYRGLVWLQSREPEMFS